MCSSDLLGVAQTAVKRFAPVLIDAASEKLKENISKMGGDGDSSNGGSSKAGAPKVAVNGLRKQRSFVNMYHEAIGDNGNGNGVLTAASGGIYGLAPATPISLTPIVATLALPGGEAERPNPN